MAVMRQTISTAKPLTLDTAASREELVRIVIGGEANFLTVEGARELNQQIVTALLGHGEPQQVLRAVMDVFVVSLQELTGRSQVHRICEARFAASYVLREGLRLAWEDVADLFGRNHASVIAGVRRCRELMEQDARYRAKVEALVKEFK